MQSWNKILVVGDLHLKSARGYADVIADRREPEEKEILDFIVGQSEGCDHIVFLGDELNSKNNPSEVVRKFTAFLERFENKTIWITVGNHNKSADGTTALDYLKEIKNKKWNIITNTVEEFEDLIFVPYFSKVEMEEETSANATQAIIDMLATRLAQGILFCHLSISGSATNSGAMTDLFDEIVLPRKKLEKMYKLVFAGHIHNPEKRDNIVVAGSIFNDEVGELRKYIWKVDKEYNVEQIPLPGRSIYKIENPTFEELVLIPVKNTIAKVVFTQKIDEEKMEKIKEQLRKFDAYTLLEQYPKERRQFSELKGAKNILDLDMPSLLKIYAEQSGKDYEKLLRGWQLIQSL